MLTFLFFNDIISANDNIIRKIAPPNCVIILAIGVKKSEIRYLDIKLYPYISNVKISSSNTSSNIPITAIKHVNNINHFMFFLINSFIFTFSVALSYIIIVVVKSLYYGMLAY